MLLHNKDQYFYFSFASMVVYSLFTIYNRKLARNQNRDIPDTTKNIQTAAFGEKMNKICKPSTTELYDITCQKDNTKNLDLVSLYLNVQLCFQLLIFHGHFHEDCICKIFAE